MRPRPLLRPALRGSQDCLHRLKVKCLPTCRDEPKLQGGVEVSIVMRRPVSRSACTDRGDDEHQGEGRRGQTDAETGSRVLASGRLPAPAIIVFAGNCFAVTCHAGHTVIRLAAKLTRLVAVPPVS